MPDFGSAIKYGYANARVKAMESKLIKRELLERMVAAKEQGSIVGMLLQTSYKEAIEEFGGESKMDTLIDFALSKNLGKETSKLVSITPKTEQDVIKPIVDVWDIDNIKILLGAVDVHAKPEQIQRYIIETRYITQARVKEILALDSVEAAINKLMLSTPYSDVLRSSLAAYKKSKNMLDVNAAIDKTHYDNLGKTIKQLNNIDKSAAGLVRKDIEMRNLMILIKGKRHDTPFSAFKEMLVSNGYTSVDDLAKLYDNSKSFDSLINNIKIFNLKEALADYNQSKNKPLVIFEIAMRSTIFDDALRTVRHSVLSFGAIVGYFYLKQVEVFTIRILVKGKSYKLSDDEIKSMITWLK